MKALNVLIVAVIVVLGIVSVALYYFLFAGNAVNSHVINPQTQQSHTTTSTSAVVQGTLVDNPTLAIANESITTPAGKEFTIAWQINNRDIRSIQETSVYVSNHSISQPATANYQISSDVSSGNIPGLFIGKLNITYPGTYYFRAHLVLDSIDYWSDERTLTVT